MRPVRVGDVHQSPIMALMGFKLGLSWFIFTVSSIVYLIGDGSADSGRPYCGCGKISGCLKLCS